MSTGRSPYPTRSRRRQQALQHQQQHQLDTTTTSNNNSAGHGLSTLMLDGDLSSSNISPRHSLGGLSASSSSSAVAAAASHFRLGQSLVQARLSPRTNHMTSPTNASGSGSGSTTTTNNNNNTRRFFESSSSNNSGNNNLWLNTSTDATGGNTPATITGTGTGTGTHSNTTSTTTTSTSTGRPSNTTMMPPPRPRNKTTQVDVYDHDHDQDDDEEQDEDEWVDGINITQLRQLAISCLAHGGSGSSGSYNNNNAYSSTNVSMACFYASMAHAKTQSPADAVLYAQALLQSPSESPKRTVRLLEQAGLFHYHHHHHGYYYSGTSTGTGTSGTPGIFIPKTLRLEAVLMATQALAKMDDWQAVLQLVEDAQLYAILRTTDTNNMNILWNHGVSPSSPPPPLEDDDDMAWQALAQAIIVPSSKTKTKTTRMMMIHPLSRLCCTRAQAYAETGHPLRAATFYQRALRIDPHCVQALEGLLDGTPLLSPQQALDLIYNHLEFGPDEAWLRALYLARVHVAAPTSSSSSTTLPATMNGTTTTTATRNIIIAKNVTGAGAIAAMNAATNGSANNNQDFTTIHDKTTMMDDPFWHDTSSIQMLTPIVPSKDSGAHDDDDDDDDDHEIDAMMGAGPNGQRRGKDSLFYEDDHDNDNTAAENNNTKAKANANANDKQEEQDAAHKRLQDLEVQGALDKLLEEFRLDQSSQVLAMAAQRAYRQSQLPLALKYCQELARVDPLCTTAAYVHVSTLVALGHKRTLFRLAHEWVEASPKSGRAWFAVGSYYFACGRYHVAQRHYCRATRLDPQVVEAWIAFGASFAACDESDQALASFRAAQRLAPGDPTSLLYIGMEYLRTNHTSLAEHFLLAAHQASRGTHRLCLNELGVWQLSEKNYDTASLWFLRTLASTSIETLEQAQAFLESPDQLSTLLDTIQDAYWEPTLFNLAHALRKTRKFRLACLCLERCLTLKPMNPSAWAALGFCQHLQGDLDAAIDTYHQALAQKPEDPFASEMLQRALQDALVHTSELFDQIGIQENTAHAANRATTTAASASVLPSATGGGGSKGRDLLQHVAAAAAAPPRDSMGTHSSYMTEDGLSISVETDMTSGDVDMG